MAEGHAGKPAVTIVANDIGSVGGMERQLTELITGLLHRGHAVTVVSWTCELPAHPRLRWVRVPGPSRPFAIAYPLFLLLASILVAVRGRGVIHCTGAIVLNRVAIRTVHLCHAAVAQVDGFRRFSRPGLGYRLNAGLAAAMSRVGERLCYRPRRSDLLVGVSTGVCGELREHFPRMRERIATVPNGVDTEAFHPVGGRTTNARSDRLDVLFVGGEWRGKGLDVALAALCECPRAVLSVVGEGDVGTFSKMARDLGVAARVRFLGATESIANRYREADVFLLPTMYETFSLATYEAAASGLPLLVTKVNGVEELLRDGENGWFIERDPGDIARRLRALQADPGVRAAMGEAARGSALEYSWERVVDRYADLYREARSTRNSAA